MTLSLFFQLAPMVPVYHRRCDESPVSGCSEEPHDPDDSSVESAGHDARLELARVIQERDANEAAFRREIESFRRRQELAVEKEKTVEQQRILVADQAAALEVQRQALQLQQQQLLEAQHQLTNNRQAVAIAQEQRNRAQAAAAARAAADENRRAQEAALADQRRQIVARDAENHALLQQQVADVIVEDAQEAQVLEPGEQPAGQPAGPEGLPVGQPAGAEPGDLPQVRKLHPFFLPFLPVNILHYHGY